MKQDTREDATRKTGKVEQLQRAAGTSLKACLMVTVLAGGMSASMAGPASAQGFFQRLFNPERQRIQQEQLRAQQLRLKAAKVKVSAPRYLNYKADVLKPVSLAPLSEKKTAEVQPTVTEGIEAQETALTGSDALPAAEVLTAFDKARPSLKGLSLTVLPEVGKALIAYYREHPDFLWVDSNGVTLKAERLRMELADAATYGLVPEDYLVPTPDLSGVDDAGRAALLMRFEMKLSAAALTYLLDAKRGRVDPNRISQYHDLPRHKVDLAAALGDLAEANDVATALRDMQPQSDHFRRLTAELKRLKAEDEDKEQIVIAPGTFLKAGKSSPEMKHIVAALAKNGSDALKTVHAETLEAYDGSDVYTPELVALVKAFQKDAGLTPDGIVGKNTIKAMVGETNAAKIAKVQLAMERSRWLPEHLGAQKVFINQAAFTATYTEAGKEPYSMRVVVGKKSNQTNFFYDKIEVVEYNPYWGVPYSIIVNEMLPKLANDPSYLDRAGYEVTTPGGRQISSASVNWYAVAAKQQSVNVRQYPGRSNALGEVKILFPNKHHIYMHDTPSKSLFKKDVRAFSHGCIRMQDPKGMAAAVLGKSKDYVSSRIASGQNEQEKVTGDIPVYVSYFTAWPEADGSGMGYYSDVYDRDRYLLKAIDKTEAARAKARQAG